MKIEGEFTGKLVQRVKDNKVDLLAQGSVSYPRMIANQVEMVTARVQGNRLKYDPLNDQEYIKVVRGPRGRRDTIIAILDQECPQK